MNDGMVNSVHVVKVIQLSNLMNPSPMRLPKSHHCPVTRKVIEMSPMGSEATEPVLTT